MHARLTPISHGIDFETVVSLDHLVTSFFHYIHDFFPAMHRSQRIRQLKRSKENQLFIQQYHERTNCFNR